MRPINTPNTTLNSRAKRGRYAYFGASVYIFLLTAGLIFIGTLIKKTATKCNFKQIQNLL